MTDRSLIASEDPPDFGTGRSHRWRVIDGNKNRTVGTIRRDLHHTLHHLVWRWWITIGQDGSAPGPPPSGESDTLAEAMAAFRAAWDRYPANPAEPHPGSWSWPHCRPPQMRGDDVPPGLGPWQPGREPRGWQAERLQQFVI